MGCQLDCLNRPHMMYPRSQSYCGLHLHLKMLICLPGILFQVIFCLTLAQALVLFPELFGASGHALS